MKKIIYGLFAVIIMCMLVACNSQQGTSEGGDNTSDGTGIEEQGQSQETEESEEGDQIDTSWYVENNTAICDGVFFVGKDLDADNYILICKDSDWALEITVFENEEQYFAYHKTSRFTVGEESDAKAQYALLDTTIWPDDTCSLNVQDGYVVMLKNGHGTLEPADGGAAPAKSISGKSRKIMDGLYLSKDIPRGSYMVTCTKTDYAMRILVFRDKDAYDQYSQADRFTVGKEQTAIEQNAMSEFYIYYGDTAYVNLTDEMTILVEGGSGTMEPVSMSWSQ